MNEQALQHFRSVCRREFQFLIDEFGFASAPLPKGKYVNQFQFRLSNGAITLVVEGVSYGMDAMVSLEDKHDRSVGVRCLVPGWKPFAKRKKKKKKNILNQDQQIARSAVLLKDHGTDILNGDLERFNKIGDRINHIMQRFKEQRATNQ
ncbi:hypothetical protein [Desulfosarcina ovata]|uniref:DUF4304 domain-containing protein n=1 Tax=Desulfosarcina ovata subsp. ovata TaxID=2752305 RepID=A0A5K8A3C4_9BACT|nr:hypothetical protein [Desulfosarcina ovata]BBO87012.1 hypothetical protein DSCOOX_01920 [Desulfosarcina ovata subsp. ovata]BBO87047.1 hypothetical protein DSCOOX_02270 [Desulfosarcina ovata subsp. ovata]